MTVKIYLKDSIRHYFFNQYNAGKINKSTVIGSAINNVVMCDMREIYQQFYYSNGNILDKEPVNVIFHTKIHLSDQHLFSISHVIEKVFYKELMDFADVYKKLTELSYKEIVVLFFEKHNIPKKCLYDEVYFESFLKVKRYRKKKLDTLPSSINICANV